MRVEVYRELNGLGTLRSIAGGIGCFVCRAEDDDGLPYRLIGLSAEVSECG